jgi:hypothetical protein
MYFSLVSILLTVAALILAVLASAQSVPAPMRAGPVGLVLPVPGGPLSAQQMEERTRTLPDGAPSTETLVSQVYRDNMGRMRVEWRMRGGHGASFRIVNLIVPVARSIATLLVDSKTADYLVAPHSGSGPFQIGAPAVGEWPSAGKWQTKTEELGTRVIEGVDVNGARTVRTSEDQPPLVAVQEVWSSQSLGLKLVIDAKGPNWKHTAKLQNLDRHEPDPALFAIPGDYAIQNP